MDADRPLAALIDRVDSLNVVGAGTHVAQLKWKYEWKYRRSVGPLHSCASACVWSCLGTQLRAAGFPTGGLQGWFLCGQAACQVSLSRADLRLFPGVPHARKEEWCEDQDSAVVIPAAHHYQQGNCHYV